MIFVSLALFILAAVFGLMNFIFVIRKKNPPKAIAYTHGTLALLGIMSLIVIAMSEVRAPYAALILFILAAMGGLTMFVKSQQKKPISTAIVIIHPLIGLLGIIALIAFLIR